MTVNEKGLEAALAIPLKGQFWPGESAMESEDSNWLYYKRERYSQIIDAYLREAAKDAEPCEACATRSPHDVCPSTGGDGGVRVRPLEWKSTGPQAEQEVAYTGIPERYVVTRHSMQKAAAQADYERRILTAIEPVAASPGVPGITREQLEQAISLNTIGGTDDFPSINGSALLSDLIDMLAAAPTSPEPSPAGGDVFSEEQARLVYDELREPLGITQFTGHSIRLIRNAVSRALSSKQRSEK